MKKLILILILAFGAALSLPATRPRVLKILQPVMRPVLDPVMRWSTQGELKRIARELETAEESLREEIPSSAEFGRWLATKYPASGAESDPWGSRYYLKVWPDSFVVGSPGPDRQQGTGDDVLVSGKRSRRDRRR
ncbi:MAG: hypothetical protein HY704_08390 [Gemmatimonadetes bacterium]|nr:hypothetical protein [Gemmatimonadota bacterium]